MMVSGLKIVISASQPSAILPFCSSSRRFAGSKVILRSASIRGSAFSSRTYLPSTLGNVPAARGCPLPLLMIASLATMPFGLTMASLISSSFITNATASIFGYSALALRKIRYNEHSYMDHLSAKCLCNPCPSPPGSRLQRPRSQSP